MRNTTFILLLLIVLACFAAIIVDGCNHGQTEVEGLRGLRSLDALQILRGEQDYLTHHEFIEALFEIKDSSDLMIRNRVVEEIEKQKAIRAGIVEKNKKLQTKFEQRWGMTIEEHCEE